MKLGKLITENKIFVIQMIKIKLKDISIFLQVQKSIKTWNDNESLWDNNFWHKNRSRSEFWSLAFYFLQQTK